MSSADPARAWSGWVSVLLYHRIVPVLPTRDPYRVCVTVATFESHLRWLARRRYRSLDLGTLAAALDGTRRGRVPSRAVAITFDDGYQDNYTYAWPLLRRYGFDATIFLVTGAIGGDNSFDAAHDGPPAAMLTRPQIEEMRRGGVGFGSHSRTHPPALTELPDDQLWAEVARSRADLEGVLDAPVEHFAYPHSKFDARVERAVARAGYTLACGGTGTRLSRFCVHRVEPPARRGVAVEVYMAWRGAKWRARRVGRRYAGPV